MPSFRLLVTEVTDYGSSLRCVAGWDVDRNEMIRPEPAAGAFWPASYIGPNGWFEVGALVQFEGYHPVPPTSFPHRTEDRVVVGVVQRLDTPTAEQRARWLAASVSPNLAAIFGGHIQVANSRGYVPLHTQCASLGAIEIRPNQLVISEDGDGRRLRCQLSHGMFGILPTITCSRIRRMYHQLGLPAVLQSFAGANRLHLRIGLARAFDAHPDRCYIQVNGIEMVG
jgi:hypothetical protein